MCVFHVQCSPFSHVCGFTHKTAKTFAIPTPCYPALGKAAGYFIANIDPDPGSVVCGDAAAGREAGAPPGGHRQPARGRRHRVQRRHLHVEGAGGAGGADRDARSERPRGGGTGGRAQDDRQGASHVPGESLAAPEAQSTRGRTRPRFSEAMGSE